MRKAQKAGNSKIQARSLQRQRGESQVNQEIWPETMYTGRKFRPAELRPADGGPRPPDGIGRDGTSVPPPSGGPSFRPPDEFDSVRRAEYSVPCVSPADETKTKLANDGFRPRTNRGGRSGGRFVAGRRSASGDETPPPGADETRGTDESAPPRTAPEFVFL